MSNATLTAPEVPGQGAGVVRRKRRPSKHTPTPTRLSRAALVRRYIVLVVVLILLVAPLMLPLLGSFKGPDEQMFGPKANLVPHQWSLDAYRTLFERTNIVGYVSNSLIICFLSVASHVLLACTAGYMLSRKGWKGRGILNVVVLAAMIFPFESIMVSLYTTVNQLGLLNSLIGVWLPGMLGPFHLLLMRAAFLGVPDEMEDAATRNRRMTGIMQGVARQVSLDPNDGMEL